MKLSRNAKIKVGCTADLMKKVPSVYTHSMKTEECPGSGGNHFQEIPGSF